RGVPAAVVRPALNDQVVALLGYAAEHGLRVVPRGAATNLCAGIAPGDDSLVLDIASMNRIVEIDAQARCAVVEPGVINADLKAAVAPLGLVYAPDPADLDDRRQYSGERRWAWVHQARRHIPPRARGRCRARRRPSGHLQ